MELHRVGGQIQPVQVDFGHRDRLLDVEAAGQILRHAAGRPDGLALAIVPLAMLVWANLILAVFNLIPVAPLDGSHVLEGLLSASSRMRLHAFYHRSQGLLLILLLVVLGVPAIRGLVMGVIMIPALIAFRLLCGIPAPL